MKKIIFIFLLCFTHLTWASLFQKIEDSIDKYHPTILEELEKVEASQNEVTQSIGSFDAKIIGESIQRVDGFYDGDMSQVRIEKGFQFLNSKFYLAHKRSDGSFPSYEGDYKTLDRGENTVGVIFSLLRNNQIDKKREQLGQSQENLKQSRLNLRQIKYLLKMLAQNILMEFQAEVRKLQVYEVLLENSQDRLKAIESKVKQGALARIYLQENEQYILKRKSFVLKTKNKIFKLSQKLSLYYRDESANPIFLDVKDVTDQLQTKVDIPNINLERDITNSYENSIELEILDSKLNQLQLKYQIGENELKPQLDLKIESSKNAGEGDESLVDTENKIMVSVEIPIERNFGKGIRNSSMAKIRGLQFKKKFLKQKISTSLREIENKLQTDSELIRNYEREATISKKLEQAEMKKFQQGVSDFFVVNMREQNTAQAQISVIEAKFDLFQTSQFYRALLAGISTL